MNKCKWKNVSSVFLSSSEYKYSPRISKETTLTSLSAWPILDRKKGGLHCILYTADEVRYPLRLNVQFDGQHAKTILIIAKYNEPVRLQSLAKSNHQPLTYCTSEWCIVRGKQEKILQTIKLSQQGSQVPTGTDRCPIENTFGTTLGGHNSFTVIAYCILWQQARSM